LPDADFARLPFGDDPWRLVAQGDALELAYLPPLFAIGDGFVGVRGPGEADGAPRIYLNGVFEKMPIVYHESAHGFAQESDVRLAAADATRPHITIDGAPLGPPERIVLDMQRGVLVADHRAGEHRVRIEQFAAMARTGLIAARIEIQAGDEPVAVAVAPRVSPPPAPAGHEDGAVHDPRVGPAFHQSPWHQVVDHGDAGRVDCLPHSGFAVAALASGVYQGEVEAGGTITIDCLAAYAARYGTGAAEASLAAAESVLADAGHAGFTSLAAEQAAWFDSYWDDAFVAFPDAPRVEQSVRHALFQLAQAVGDGSASIGAKGQTGEGYEGHVFWDADSYVLPALLAIRPELARNMLGWRIDRLEGARANARAMGQAQGALYPWRTIAGRECSAYFPAGSAQYHINADIAQALSRYLAMTGDHALLSRGGAEMLVETARIWLEIGFHDADRDDSFVINRVTGPDEYSALVDNNLYTNMLAAEHLRLAAGVGAEAGLIDEDEAARMRRAADMMRLPFDDARGIYAQDESCFALQPWPFAKTPADRYPLLLHFHPLTIYRHRVSKQADAVLLLATLPDRFDRSMRRRMLDVYEVTTVHDSTLSASAFATVAAQAGDPVRAARYWRLSVLTDLLNLFGNSSHGLHMAALGGGFTALVSGFGGTRVADGQLAFAPVAIPDIGRYAFRIRYQGRQIEVACDANGAARYRLVSGDPLTIRSHDTPVALAANETVSA
jgi:alpha,alpha-trehalose phosphorylase